MTHTTDIFTMPRQKFALLMLRMYGMPWVGGAVVALMLCGVLAAAHDLRWIIVGLMVVCIVAPMVLALLYLNHGTRRPCVANVLPHYLEFTPEGVSATLVDEEQQPVATYRFDSALLKPYTVGLNSVVLPLHKPEGGFLWVPLSAFPDTEAFTAAIAMAGEAIAGGKKQKNIAIQNF